MLAAAAVAGGVRWAGASELHAAIRSNDLGRVEAILEAAPAGAANTPLTGGIMPLHLAAAIDAREIVLLLLGGGANVDARTTGGFTALHWAASRNAAAAAQTLVAGGSDINARSADGVTPLHWAASKNATAVVQLLIAAGADLHAKATSGLTPLHWAVANGAEHAAALLAYKAVSDELDAAKGQPEQTEAVEPEPSEAATSARATGSSDSDLLAPVVSRETWVAATSGVSVVPMPEQTLPIDLGLGETLVFVWIEPLRLWVGKYEVSNGQFRRFRPSHDSKSRGDFSLCGNDQPVVNVSWYDAAAYADWLNRMYTSSVPPGATFRLPASAEWTAFASCATDRKYPWGNEWPPPYGNFSDLAARREFTDWVGISGYDDGYPVTAPVTAAGSNEWGLFGLAGNVAEWCMDWYDQARKYRIRHGASWDFDREPALRVRTRGFDRPAVRCDTVGFRLVVALRAEAPPASASEEQVAGDLDAGL
jgi:hypothetical protein